MGGNSGLVRHDHKGLIFFTLAIMLVSSQPFAQTRKPKVPGLSKLGGTQRLAFSGIVTSLDMKMKVLSVQRVEGKDVEIFPVKKATHIEDADGKRLGFKALAPGTNILIYYNEKAGERKITQVVVLGVEKGRNKKANSPSS